MAVRRTSSASRFTASLFIVFPVHATLFSDLMDESSEFRVVGDEYFPSPNGSGNAWSGDIQVSCNVDSGVADGMCQVTENTASFCYAQPSQPRCQFLFFYLERSRNCFHDPLESYLFDRYVQLCPADNLFYEGAIAKYA